MEERTPPPSDGTESPRILRARAEKFGALLATESPTAVIAVDRTLAARLGVDGGALWNDADGSVDVRMYEGPVEVHLAVTAHCPAGCPGCYVDATLGGEHVALDVLRGRLDDIRALGAFRVALGGGEAMLHPDLGAVLAHGRALGLEMSVTTSGLGLTAARAAMLDGASQVNVSHDGLGPDYETVRGYDGSGVAERSIRMLVAAGVRVGVNTVLTRSNFAGVPELAARIRDLGAGELQLLRYKPGGRANLDYLARRLTPDQVRAVPALLRAVVALGGFSLRIDCSMVPFLAADSALAAEDLFRFGVEGCEAGRALATVGTSGAVKPCSFWPGDGNRAATLDDAWRHGDDLEGARDHVFEAPMPCRTCPLQRVCRGGCRVVATHVEGDARAPDPECPRVIAWRAAADTEA